MFGSINSREGDLFERFNRLHRDFEDFWGSTSGPASIRAVARGSFPAINVGSTEDGVDVYVFAAGLDQSKLEISIQQNLLTISGECADLRPEDTNVYLNERFSGGFKRSLSLPEDVDPDSANASYRNGILHVGLKRKAEARRRRIEINA